VKKDEYAILFVEKFCSENVSEAGKLISVVGQFMCSLYWLVQTPYTAVLPRTTTRYYCHARNLVLIPVRNCVSIKLSAIQLEGTSLFDVGSNRANSGSKNESIPRLLSPITLKYIADHVNELHHFCFLVVEKY